MTKLYLNHFESNEVADKFQSYPLALRSKLMKLRQLIFETANELEIGDLQETLKWGQPSYLSKQGSAVRIDWKGLSSPDEYAIFFHCKTKLVDTFKEIYPAVFKYKGNRAIVFKIDDNIPINKLKHCIELSLTYHTISNLPLLGV